MKQLGIGQRGYIFEISQKEKEILFGDKVIGNDNEEKIAHVEKWKNVYSTFLRALREIERGKDLFEQLLVILYPKEKSE